MQNAIETENLEQIENLLTNGHDPNEIIENGQTLLFQTSNINIIKLLLEYGADPKAVDEYGFTVSDYTDNAEIISLIKAETKPTKFSKYKSTIKSKTNRGKTKKNHVHNQQMKKKIDISGSNN
jgi:ankyrin repeat protein